ncbi:hypothetical protein RJ55_08253 [Drechmeria coniospora]|nr:hypothetical protein RJ55_08253 [Drechmeria coniospora]
MAHLGETKLEQMRCDMGDEDEETVYSEAPAPYKVTGCHHANVVDARREASCVRRLGANQKSHASARVARTRQRCTEDGVQVSEWQMSAHCGRSIAVAGSGWWILVGRGFAAEDIKFRPVGPAGASSCLDRHLGNRFQLLMYPLECWARRPICHLVAIISTRPTSAPWHTGTGFVGRLCAAPICSLLSRQQANREEGGHASSLGTTGGPATAASRAPRIYSVPVPLALLFRGRGKGREHLRTCSTPHAHYTDAGGAGNADARMQQGGVHRARSGSVVLPATASGARRRAPHGRWHGSGRLPWPGSRSGFGEAGSVSGWQRDGAGMREMTRWRRVPDERGTGGDRIERERTRSGEGSGGAGQEGSDHQDAARPPAVPAVAAAAGRRPSFLPAERLDGWTAGRRASDSPIRYRPRTQAAICTHISTSDDGGLPDPNSTVSRGKA